MKLVNDTTQKQQINFIDGTTVTVRSRDPITIDPSNIYKEELDRIGFIFKVITPVVPEVKKKVPATKKKDPVKQKAPSLFGDVKEEKINGGGV